MARFLLLDLSNNNTPVKAWEIKEAGIAGFWHKVSEGSSFADPYWQSRSAAGRVNGLRVGGYHFARPGTLADAEREAEFFAVHLGTVKRRDLCPVLDLEVAEGLRPSALEQWARIFNHAFHELRGVWPLFYSYPAFIESLRLERTIGRGLWLASYGRNDGREYPYQVPHPYRKALAHQFTSKARVSGVTGLCDLSSAPRLYPLLARGLRGLP